MVNRVLEAKRIKMRRRKRFAVFSGGDTKVFAGKVSLSKQVINIGLRVPGRNIPNMSLNQDRVPLNPKKDLISDVRKSLQIPMSEDQQIRTRVLLKDQDLGLKRRIFNGRTVKVWVFFNLAMTEIYLLRVDFRLDLIQRSINFSSLEQAQDVFAKGNVPWL